MHVIGAILHLPYAEDLEDGLPFDIEQSSLQREGDRFEPVILVFLLHIVFAPLVKRRRVHQAVWRHSFSEFFDKHVLIGSNARVTQSHDSFPGGQSVLRGTSRSLPTARS